MRADSDRMRMSLTRRGAMHPVLASGIALSASLLAAAVMYLLAGPQAVDTILRHAQLQWMALAAACEYVSLLSYALAYQQVVSTHGHHRLSARLSVRLTVAGFGAFAVVGGFSLDRRALRLLGAERHAALMSVLALGLFELSILAPAAFVTAVILLSGHTSVMSSMLWPWVIGTPVVIGTAGALMWWTRDGRRHRSSIFEDGVETVALMLRSSSSIRAWAGLGLYFAAEMAALALALRSFGLTIGAGPLIIAYASGYLLTRRTLPLGGAGFVEVLLTLSLHWVGVPVAAAFAGVIAYRALNFLLIALLALFVRLGLAPTMRAASEVEDRMAFLGAEV